MMWVVAALALAAAMTPLYVSLCHSLAAVSSRNAHRLAASQRGSAELERIRSGAPLADRSFPVPELPGGRGSVEVSAGPAPSLARVTIALRWNESGSEGRAAWTTLARRRP